ncbi:MAG: molybdopterin-guanine dinucleotide biosynthesis protein B [Hyphomicrobium sp.]
MTLNSKALVTRSSSNPRTPVIGIAGWKKSGKTTLSVHLVEEFTRRGLRVATVKHAHHEFQVDDGETDSARHRRAGASEVAIVGGKRWAIVHELREEPEPNFEEVISWLSPADLILVEGYKSAPICKIEARRSAQSDRRSLTNSDELVIAIAADHAVAAETNVRAVPVLSLDDVVGIADLIEETIGPLGRRRRDTDASGKHTSPSRPLARDDRE